MCRVLKRYSWLLIIVMVWIVSCEAMGPRTDRDGRLPQDVARLFVEAVQADDFDRAASYWREGDQRNLEVKWEMTFPEFCVEKFKANTFRLSSVWRYNGFHAVTFYGKNDGVETKYNLFLKLIDGRWHLIQDKWIESQFTPTEETRFIIEKCEALEGEVAEEVETPPTANLNAWFVPAVRTTQSYAVGTIKLSQDDPPLILDKWGRPLQMMLQTSLAEITDVSQQFLAKTNRIIIWSLGENGLNEYGKGDDVFLKPGETWDKPIGESGETPSNRPWATDW